MSRIRERKLMHTCGPRFCFVQIPLVTRHEVILWRKVKNERGVEWIKALHHIPQLFTKTFHNAWIICHFLRFLLRKENAGLVYIQSKPFAIFDGSLYKSYTIVHKIFSLGNKYKVSNFIKSFYRSAKSIKNISHSIELIYRNSFDNFYFLRNLEH